MADVEEQMEELENALTTQVETLERIEEDRLDEESSLPPRNNHGQEEAEGGGVDTPGGG